MKAAGDAGLRSVALFEAAKGTLVILAGFGMVSIVHRNSQQLAEHLVRHLHLNPAKHYPHIFIDAAGRLDDVHIWLLAGGAFLYSLVRFIEAYGLWHSRVWAEWFAILSGAVYVPFEVAGLARRVTGLRTVLLAVNLSVVAYVLLFRHKERRRKNCR